MKDRVHDPTGKAILQDEDQRRQAKLREIRRLQLRSYFGVLGLVIFLVISLGAVQEFSFLPALPTDIREILGAAPPVRLISIALVVYSFSALILTLSRMWSGSDAYRGWSHLGYLTAFYAFYGFAEALDENFLAVFAAGLTILGLEHYHLWSHCNEAIDREKQLLARLDRR
jgi:hypothetical protein